MCILIIIINLNIKIIKDMKPHIALVCMVKNEEARIHVTLNSIIGVCSSLIIYDTGSTDNTIKVIKDFSKKHKILLRLIEETPIFKGNYFDYASNRNTLLKFVDTFTDIDFCLLMDCNDELRGGDYLLKYVESEISSKNTIYNTCQLWYSGTYSKYFNSRLIKPRKGWYYKMPVHEYLENSQNIKHCEKMSDNIILYQDRTRDDNKSYERHHRDVKLLLLEYKSNQNDTRVVFYLAQSYECIKDYKNAMKYYKLRSEMGGWDQEVYLSLYRYAINNKNNGGSLIEYVNNLLVAHKYRPIRLEALYKVIHYCRLNKLYEIGYQLGKEFIMKPYPDDNLFVEMNIHIFLFDDEVGLCAYYTGRYEESRKIYNNILSTKKLDKNTKTRIKVNYEWTLKETNK